MEPPAGIEPATCDEVQQVLEYESDLVERRLRSIIQKHEQVSYIFLGS